MKKLATDAGHGMANRQPGVFDPGAVHVEDGTTFREADIALDYALELRDLLASQNVAIFMTRDDDGDPAPVARRASRARDAGCAVFVSFHLNAAEDDDAHGTEVLHRDATSLPLAKALCQAVVGVTGFKDRGTKVRTDLAVLRFAGPAALIELGFIGNDPDRNALRQPGVRAVVSAKIADALRPFLV